MGRNANFYIRKVIPGVSITIEDIGPWDQCLTVTNDAEGVVKRLMASGFLTEGMRLYYIDSDGRHDEITIESGAFSGFAPGQEEEEG